MGNEGNIALLYEQATLKRNALYGNLISLEQLTRVAVKLISGSEIPIFFELRPEMKALTHAVVEVEKIEHLQKVFGIKLVKLSDGRYLGTYEGCLIVFGVV